jgi:hypothetical protein
LKPLQSEPEKAERDIERLTREVERLRQKLIERDRKLLEAEKQIADLERKLALRLQNSVTSSKPPSSDGLAGEQRPRGAASAPPPASSAAMSFRLAIPRGIALQQGPLHQP